MNNAEINNIDINTLPIEPEPETISTPKKKHAGGRPRKLNIPIDKEYNNVYYHTTKKEIKCECGMVVLSRCLNRHLKRNIHKLTLLENFNKEV